MDWLNYQIEKLPRVGNFPYRVKMLYFSRQHTVNIKHGRTPDDMLEISIRLEPREATCRDIINGKPICTNFPNLVWKKPGGEHRFLIDKPRDAISFGYPAEFISDLRHLGLYPDLDAVSFTMTPEIGRLANEYRRLCHQLYTPGVADQLDWICFLLYREILYSNLLKTKSNDDVERIRNISVWMQLHISEDIDLDRLSSSNGFSRTSFYRKWRHIFKVSPAQYVLDLKIEAAARLLQETTMSINEIVQEINYSGTTAFHKRFTQKYGMTPSQFRKSRET